MLTNTKPVAAAQATPFWPFPLGAALLFGCGGETDVASRPEASPDVATVVEPEGDTDASANAEGSNTDDSSADRADGSGAEPPDGSGADAWAQTDTPADAGPPSCELGGPGMTNGGSAAESCCTTLTLPGGTFFRTYDPTDTNGD